MKRSFIDAKIDEGIEFCRAQNFHLPKWACWTPEDWACAGAEADEIRQRELGWDVTDFGSDDYANCGLLCFTIRNGILVDEPDAMIKDYCEKLLLVDENQYTPIHFHWHKMEDIINRGGGKLLIELWNADRDSEQLDEQSEVSVSIDGIRHQVAPGGTVALKPGESITLEPYMYHTFYAEPDKGMVLGGEVSRVNDDTHDNRFLKPLPRFPAIDEDAPPRHLLCNEYSPAKA